MLRKDLLVDLNTIAPGLANKDLIPLLTHVWFTGTRVMTFNEQIAISASCKTDFVGAVPGEVLIKLVSASKARDVELIQDGNILQIKMGGSKLKLNMLEMEETLFKMPPQKKEYILFPKSKTKIFIDAIRSCLRSTSTDTSAPERIGITLISTGKTILMYSTNNATISHEELPIINKPKFTRVILSSIFCEQLVAIADRSEEIEIEIHDEFSLVIFDKKISLFGNLIQDSDSPLDFQRIMKERIPENYVKNVSIPSRMALAIERALVITQSKVDEVDSEFSIKDGIMTIYSKSKIYGDITDRIKLEGKHPDTKIKVHCKYLKKDLSFFKNMFVTKDCWIMLGEKSIYLIAGS